MNSIILVYDPAAPFYNSYTVFTRKQVVHAFGCVKNLIFLRKEFLCLICSYLLKNMIWDWFSQENLYFNPFLLLRRECWILPFTLLKTLKKYLILFFKSLFLFDLVVRIIMKTFKLHTSSSSRYNPLISLQSYPLLMSLQTLFGLTWPEPFTLLWSRKHKTPIREVSGYTRYSFIRLASPLFCETLGRLRLLFTFASRNFIRLIYLFLFFQQQHCMKVICMRKGPLVTVIQFFGTSIN